jgi:hypothetical protein
MADVGDAHVEDLVSWNRLQLLTVVFGSSQVNWLFLR